MSKKEAQALQTVGDMSQGLAPRLAALNELAGNRTPEVVAGLHELLGRKRQIPEVASLNWDPIALERVIDLHIIRVLHALGDDSGIAHIAELVAQAGRVLAGPEDEISNAAQVILATGLTAPIHQLAELAGAGGRTAGPNAVRVLDRLHLPRPPVCGPVPDAPALHQPLEFEIHTLRQELETIEKLSQGSIRLSPGVQHLLVAGDYDRGGVRRSGVTLASILRNDLEFLDLEYYTERSVVFVCTFSEAGQRWQKWWQSGGKALRFNGVSFELAPPQ